MSLVSVCVPIYNGEKYLRESMDSIINQTYQDLEILVVDDCSTDKSTDIIKEYQSDDNRIKMVHNKKNLGLVGNWNKCISEASGDFVKLQFQDDMMLEDTIEKMMSLAQDKEVDVVLTDREYTFENDINHFYLDQLPRLSDHFKEDAVIEPSFIIDLLLEKGTNMNFMGEPILGLVKKEVFDKYGVYDDTFYQIGDFEFWIRLAINVKIGFIPERLHIFRLHNESQGAKNSRATEINPSHLDRIHLTSKMHSDQSYQKFKDVAGDSFAEDLLKKYVNEYTKRYGQEKLATRIDESFFQYIEPEKTRWEKLLGIFSSKN